MASTKGRFDRSKARFYLVFPHTHEDELNFVKSWLQTNTLPKLVSTSADDDGWETFKVCKGLLNEAIDNCIQPAKLKQGDIWFNE